MIPIIPLATKLFTSLIYKEVEQLVTEHNSARMRLQTKLEPRVKIKGKKTYAGIIVLAASFFAPELGLTEGEVSQVISQITGVLGTLLAFYGRWDASRG